MATKTKTAKGATKRSSGKATKTTRKGAKGKGTGKARIGSVPKTVHLPKGAKQPVGNCQGQGVLRHKGLPASPKQLAVLGALAKLGATSPSKAKPATAVVNAASGVLSAVNVRHHCYHGTCPVQPNGATGAITGVVTNFGNGNGYGYYITPAGKALLAALAKGKGKATK